MKGKLFPAPTAGTASAGASSAGPRGTTPATAATSLIRRGKKKGLADTASAWVGSTPTELLSLPKMSSSSTQSATPSRAFLLSPSTICPNLLIYNLLFFYIVTTSLERKPMFDSADSRGRPIWGTRRPSDFAPPPDENADQQTRAANIESYAKRVAAGLPIFEDPSSK